MLFSARSARTQRNACVYVPPLLVVTGLVVTGSFSLCVLRSLHLAVVLRVAQHLLPLAYHVEVKLGEH